MVLYKTNDCPWCEKVIKYLNSKGAEFTIKNCSENEEYKNELINITRQNSVPVIVAGEKFVLGFDKKAIDELLG